MGTINLLASSYLQSVVSTALQTTGLTSNSSSKNLNSTGVSSTGLASDSPQLSPFAQLMSQLQQLQQTDPTKYQQVTQQISTNLQTASQTAETNGNSAASAQLSQLATDFKNASQNGQLPNVQDLAQAIRGGGHHHHHHHAAASSSDSDSSSGSSSSSSSAAQALEQLLAAFQGNSTSGNSSASQTSNSLDPMSIIENTLTSAGVGVTNGWRMDAVSPMNTALAGLMQSLSNVGSPVLSSPAAVAALEKAPPGDIVQLSAAVAQLQGVDAMFGNADSSTTTASDPFANLGATPQMGGLDSLFGLGASPAGSTAGSTPPSSLFDVLG